MVVKKQSHLTYPEIEIDKTQVDDNADLTLADTIEMIVGDINGDEIIKLPDRAELMRFLTVRNRGYWIKHGLRRRT